MSKIKENTVVFGLDSGDGEFSVYFLLPHSEDTNPKSVFTPETQLSGYAKTNEGSYMYGNALFDIDYSNLKRVKSFNINFKSTPGSGNDETIKEFIGIIHDEVRKEVPQYFDNTCEPIWFIGCPSEWQHKDGNLKDMYLEIFKEAGLNDARICDESTAALAYYDKALSAVSIKSIEAGVLLLDYGSSTLDATFITPSQNTTEVSAYGCALGAAFIENAMLYAMLYQSEMFDKKEDYNSHQLLKKVQEKYETDEPFRNWMILSTRRLKELHFNVRKQGGFQLNTSTINKPLPLEIDWGEKRASITLYMNETMMDKILNSPIKDVVPHFNDMSDFTKEDIGNQSWIERNNRFLEHVKNEHSAYAEKEGALMVLTGGASQMDFVRDAIIEYFPNCKASFDTNPSTTIAQGLTYWGPSLLRSKEFDKAFDEILEMPHKDENGNIVVDSDGDVQSELLHITIESYGLLLQDVIEEIAVMEGKVIADALVKWLEMDIRSESIINVAAAKFKEWMDTKMIEIYEKGVKDYRNNIKDKVNEMFRDLYVKNGLFIELFTDNTLDSILVNPTRDLLKNNVKSQLFNEIKSLNSSFANLGNGLKIFRAQKIDQDTAIKLINQIQTNAYEWLYEVFTSEVYMEALVYDVFSAIKTELDSKKENALYNLGLIN